MKKVLAFVLALLMVLSLAACQQGKETEPADKTTTKAADTTTKAPDKETDKPEPPKEVITVNYFCSIGAYLDTLQALVNEFNEGEGKEKGVFIKLESEIENPTTVLDGLVESGNYPDIFTSANPNLERYAKGYYKNLYDVDDPDVQKLIANAQPYIDASFDTFGISADHFLCSIPLEVLPIKMPINLDLFKEAGVDEPKTWDDVLDAAEKITNLGKAGTKGFGWSTWSAVWRRLTFKSTIPSAKKAWWDPNTATYDFSQYKPVMEAEFKMYKEGWMLGADDLGIDPIRNEFSEGHVGMFISPSYDYGVFTTQFPAKCNWKFIDMPIFGDGNNKAKGCYFSRGGHAIFAKAYDEADQAKKDAIEIAYAFIEGDYVVQKCAETGALIPFPGRFDNLDLSGLKEQFAQMADTEGYEAVPIYPDSAVKPYLEGETYDKIFTAAMQGKFEGGLDAAIQDCNTRYNAAWAAAKADPDMASALGAYQYTYMFDGK
ncbi:MAG: extracellular solute-binding protein [Lachnospiraceae bacterium]|nr:extracellular solute-binding protein [Lachnospiraceae bacterium]